LRLVVDEMNRYWRAAVQPIWQRVQSLTAADLYYRMEQFARGGVAEVLGKLHPDMRLDDDRLHIDRPHHCHHTYDLTTSGILLLPCVFSWPTLVVGCCGVDQPTLTYPARGVAGLREAARGEGTDPLSALVGRTRATLLAHLDLPLSTTELAKQLDITPAAVSQHLKVLKAAGLATSWRRGRMVFYQRTTGATALLSTSRQP
jgi:DNA-binding transcriptional ArsR family regulator